MLCQITLSLSKIRAMNHISSENCKKLIDNQEATIIDIREDWEVAICSIDGLKIPMHQIPEKAQSLDKSKHYIIMCKTGKRAEPVANLLECECGFKHISILEGGITSWYENFDPSFEMY